METSISELFCFANKTGFLEGLGKSLEGGFSQSPKKIALAQLL